MRIHEYDNSDSGEKNLPVIVIGAGPIGLSAAAQLLKKGELPLVLEQGSSVGESVSRWGHVRVFSPWKYNVDKTAAEFLEKTDWIQPDPEQLPLGSEIVERYLLPLARLPEFRSKITLGARVVSVSRLGLDKVTSGGRDRTPFEVIYEQHAERKSILAKAVIDASGTYSNPNPLGSSGVEALGEEEFQARIFYGIPDLADKDHMRYSGKRIAVVGGGHSALTVLVNLGELATRQAATKITWLIRRNRQYFGGGDHDELAARGALGKRVRGLVEEGMIDMVSSFKLTKLVPAGDAISIEGLTGSIGPVDEIIACTGFRPDFTFARELRLSLDPAIESSEAIASMVDPNLHSCGTVEPHGADDLKHPERDFYIVGMKSYGRAPTFLMLTGYEQVRSVVCAIVGDVEGARAVKLQLPATGVCFTDLKEAEPCCQQAGLEIGAKTCCASSPVAKASLPAPEDPITDCCAPSFEGIL